MLSTTDFGGNEQKTMFKEWTPTTSIHILAMIWSRCVYLNSRVLKQSSRFIRCQILWKERWPCEELYNQPHLGHMH
jgi:hypothetical protein